MSSDLNVATSTIILITIAVLTWLTVFILGTFVAVMLCIRARLNQVICNYNIHCKNEFVILTDQLLPQLHVHL